MTLSGATPALESTVNSLKARMDNLSPPSKHLAEGILKTVEHTKRVSPAQAAQISRLERLSRKKFKSQANPDRGYRWEALPGETPEQTYARRKFQISAADHRPIRTRETGYVSTAEQKRLAYARAEHEFKIATDPAYAEAAKRQEARSGAFVEALVEGVGMGDQKEKILLRSSVKHYHRGDILPLALPLHVLPETLDRKILIGCLIRRLRMLRAEPILGNMHDAAKARAKIQHVRAALICEGIALLRDRAQARLLAFEMDQDGTTYDDEVPAKQLDEEFEG